MAKEKKENRKNYSLNPIVARALGIHAINMSTEIGRTIPKQDILDALVVLLNDQKIYKRVLTSLKK